MDGFHRGHPFPYRHPAENTDQPLTEQELARLVTRVTGVTFDEEAIVKTAEQTNATDAVMQDPQLKSQIEKKNRALLRNTSAVAIALIALAALVVSRLMSNGSLWWAILLIVAFPAALYLQCRAEEKGTAFKKRYIAEALRRIAQIPVGYFLKSHLKERIVSLRKRLIQEHGAIPTIRTSLLAQQQTRTSDFDTDAKRRRNILAISERMAGEVQQCLKETEEASRRLERDLASHATTKNAADRQLYADRLTHESKIIGCSLISLQRLADALEKAHEAFARSDVGSRSRRRHHGTFYR